MFLNINSVPFIVLALITIKSVVSQHLNSFEVDGVQYFFDDVKRNFTDSRLFCQINDGDLIQTAQRSVIKNLHGHVYWLGVPATHNRVFTHYLNGQPIRSTNWMAGQPNGHGCQGIQVDMRNSLGFWLDFDCADKVTTVCEKRLDTSGAHRQGLAASPSAVASAVTSAKTAMLSDAKLQQFIKSVDHLNTLLTTRSKESAVSKFMVDSMYCANGTEPRCRTACDLCTEEEAATSTTDNNKLYSCCTQQCICETN